MEKLALADPRFWFDVLLAVVALVVRLWPRKPTQLRITVVLRRRRGKRPAGNDA